ncbi:ABC transporter permease [Nonomuraea sp. NPDC050540]|uniref:ABC transporter permease n=1 Tax=Nonomuraea sp. NPDC050540 TaxID=3364367 RepID=UPI00379E7578
MRAPWLVIAATELRLILRNKLVAAIALLVPLAFGAVFAFGGSDGDMPPPVRAMVQIATLLAFTVYCTATTTLTARRQGLYLKRLRTSRASTMSIVTGLAAPLFVVVIVQAGLLTGVSGVYRGQWPERPWTLVLALVIGSVTCAAVAFLTAAFTSSPEMAQVTTMPFMLSLIGSTIWVIDRPSGQVDWIGLAIPGGALAHLTRAAWGESHLVAEVLPAAAVALVTAAVSIGLAVRLFRWEPRA